MGSVAKPLGNVMAFSRSSGGNRYKKDGTQETMASNVVRSNYDPATARTNLVRFSDNPAANGGPVGGAGGGSTRWAVIGGTYQDLGGGVYRFTEDTSNSLGHAVCSPLMSPPIASFDFCLSFEIKPETATKIGITSKNQFLTSNDATTKFNLATGTFISNSGTAPVGYGIIPLPDGWFRIYRVNNIGTGASFRSAGLVTLNPATDSTDGFNGTGRSFLFRKPMINYGTSPQTYVGTDSAPVTELDPAGILLEGTRTNLIRNNTMIGGVDGGAYPTNWSATFAAGLSVTRTYGTDMGMSYVDLDVSGTPATSPHLQVFYEPVGQIPSANNVTWAQGVFTKLIAGDLTGVSSISQRLSLYDGSSALLPGLNGADFKAYVTPLLYRATEVQTTNNASVAYIRPFIAFSGSGTAVAYKIRLYLPTLEQAPFVSSPIPSPGTSGTRQQDFFIKPDLYNLPFNFQAGFGFVIEVDLTSPTNNGNGRIMYLSDGTTQNRINLRLNSTGQGFNVDITKNNVTSTGVGVVVNPIVGKQRIACRIQNGIIAMSINGGVVATGSGAILPDTCRRIYFGSNGDSNLPMFGHLRDFQLLPYLPTDVQLPALSAI